MENIQNRGNGLLNLDSTEFGSYFYEAAKKHDIKISESEIGKFLKYKDLLISWNEKINLTTITEDSQIVLKHFIDSLTIMRHIKSGSSVIDVGTGAGFPGLPLKICDDSIRLTLLDSLNKRINFLKAVSDELSLSGINFVHLRAEDGGSDGALREKFDVAVSRAVANLSVLCEYCLPFVKIGGIFIAMKGADLQEEMENAKTAVFEMGGRIISAENFCLGENADKRTVIIIEKARKTPRKYPRKAGIPAKNPL